MNVKAPIPIGSWTPESLVDYPGHIASVIYTHGCNFWCPYCHNQDLLHSYSTKDQKTFEDILPNILSNKLITGVVFTGGEPSVRPYMVKKMISTIRRESNLKIKIDTNGSSRDFISYARKNADFIAMDFKTLRYSEISKITIKEMRGRMQMLTYSKIPYEIRITMYPPLIDKSEFDPMIQTLVDCRVRNVAVQQYRPISSTASAPYPIAVLEQFSERLEKRGIKVRRGWL